MNIKRVIKRALPESYVNRLRRWKRGLQASTFSALVRSKRLSSLYWGLFPASLADEHYGVVYGMVKYARESLVPQETQYLLRRNIHRLEKGLLMQPRRDLFALDYIRETVERYLTVAKNPPSDLAGSELQWAHDVLTQYFSIVDAHPIVDAARVRFESSVVPFPDSGCVPYKRNLEMSSPVNYDELLALSRRRKSVRWYLQEPVPRDLIDKAITVAAYSPSACNRQPFQFRVFDDPQLVRQIASLPGGTAGFDHNFPAVVVIVGKWRAYFTERDRHLIYIDASLAAMSFMYALETLGLSSCCINWHDDKARTAKMSRLLRLEPDERVIMLISVGYPDPDGRVAYSQRKRLDQLRRYN